MKILLLYLGRRGGGAVDVFELSEGFAHNKISHDVLLSNENYLKSEWQNHVYRKVYFIDTYRKSFKNFLLKTFLSIRPILLIRKILLIKPDIIHLTTIHPWFVFVVLYCKFIDKNIKLVFNCHDEKPHLGNDIHFLELVNKFVYRNVNGVFTLSNFVKKTLIDKFNIHEEKIFSFRLGEHYHLSRTINKDSGFMKDTILHMVFFGRIQEYKGVDILVNAFENLCKEKDSTKYQLTIAGEGTVNQDLINKIDQLDVIFINYWISDNQLIDLLKDTDVIIIPYKEGTQSGPASIAISAGIPVIATNVGGIPEQVLDGVNGILIPPNDDVALKNAMTRFSDRKLLEKMSYACKDLAKSTFSWDIIANQMYDIYKIL
jgi:glycosyltransferase involved in cell wall biosynthesis